MKTAKKGLFSRFSHRFFALFHPETHSTQLDGVSNPQKHFRATPGTHVSARTDGLTILHIQSGRVFVCNSTGARIWQGVLKGLSVDAISNEISAAHSLPHEAAERDTALFISELQRNGLVVRA